MLKKTVSAIMLALLLISMLTFAFKIHPVMSDWTGTIQIEYDGSVDPPTAPIQREGDIYTFTDNIYGDIWVQRSNVVIDGAGYTLQGDYEKGIDLSPSEFPPSYTNDVTIKNMRIQGFDVGIEIYESSQNSILDNHFMNNVISIELIMGTENNIDRNDIMNSEQSGIFLSGSSYNTIVENNFTNCGLNFYFGGDGDHNIVEDNTVNGKPLVYLESVVDYTVQDAGQVVLVFCDNIRVENLEIFNASVGIQLCGTSNSRIVGNIVANNSNYGIAIDKNGPYMTSRNNTIAENRMANNRMGIHIGSSCSTNMIDRNDITICDTGIRLDSYSLNNIINENNIARNRVGIYLWYGTNNIVSGNKIEGNTQCGIAIGAENNKIYHNDFGHNPVQIQFECANVWDDGYPSGGNYWSDYANVDLYGGPYQNETGGDGIWDHPYVIDANNKDHYPLVNPCTPTPPTTDFLITASPTSLTIQQGSSSTSTITLTSMNGFNQPVQLSTSGATSGITATLNPTQVTPPADGSISSTLTVSADTTAPLGSYSLTVTGTSGALTHSVYISLEITAIPQTLFSQYRQSGLELSVGGMIDESTVKFAGIVSSPNGGLVRLEVELRQLTEYNGQFDETKGGLKESQLVDSGSLATIQVYDLIRGQYHWRARTVDEHGTYKSEWQDFGNNNIKEPDFTVCNKFKVIYPEGWMNLQLFVPSAYSPVGYLDKVKFGLFNKRDMWYKITASRKVLGGFWEDITDQIWKVPYVGPYSSAGESLLYSPIDGEEIKIELKNVFGLDPVLTGYMIVDLAARWGLGLCLPPNALSLLSNDRWVQLKAELTEFFNNRIAQRLSEFTFWSLEKFLVAGFKAMAEYRPLLSSILIDMGLPIAEAAKLVNVVIKIADKAFFLYDFVNAAIVSKDLWASMISESQEENVILAVEERLTTTVAPNLILTEGLRVTPEGTYLQGDKINANFAIKNVGLLPINLHALTVGGRTEEGYVQDFSFKTDVTINPGETYSYEGELPLLYEGRNSFFVAAQSEDGEWITDVPTEAGLANTLYVDVEPVLIVVAGYLGSPGELRVYDSQGRVTGLVAGETICEIPHSFYYDNMITIFSPEDDLTYCVVGTEHGTYNLEIVRSDHGEVTTFAAKDIATSPSTVHEFSFDWTALSQDREGVIVQVDSNGDGMFEHTFTSDSELTQSEYILATDTIPPQTWLDIGNPKFLTASGTCLTSNTPFVLSTEDDLGGSGVATTAYRIRNDTYIGDWMGGQETFYLVGFSDGTYQIDYNSTDNAGNVEPTNTATVILDNTPPATSITFGAPNFVTSSSTFVTSETSFALFANDNLGSGVAASFYEIHNSTYNSGWLTYKGLFCLTKLAVGNYTIAYYSVDNVGNQELMHSVKVSLFSWTYAFNDYCGRKTTLRINVEYKLFWFAAPGKDFGVKRDPSMSKVCDFLIICYNDKAMSLDAVVTVKLNFCAAIAFDKQTRKTYLLINKPFPYWLGRLLDS